MAQQRNDGRNWAFAIQHPLDRMYLKKINGIPLMPKIMGWVLDKQRAEMEALFSGDGVLVTKKSCNEVDEAFKEACDALDLCRDAFRVFVVQDPTINAFTTGSDVPIVVATSGLINASSKEELRFVFGHELGHYICGHVRCHALARLLQVGIGGAGILSAGLALPAYVSVKLLQPLLMSWSRYSELSADRAGLLAARDFEAICMSLLKLGGFPSLKTMQTTPSQVLMNQHIDYSRQTGEFSILHRLWRECTHGCCATHPRVIERFAAIDAWRDEGSYDEIADATYAERVRLSDAIGGDYLRHELYRSIVDITAEYLERKLGRSRKTTLRLLRKAFMQGESLRGTFLEDIVYAELKIMKNGDEFLYSVAIILLQGQEQPMKVTLSLDYARDYAFAPEGIRARFIECRADELTAVIYKP